MHSKKNSFDKIILLIICSTVFILGIILFFIPPALFPDPAQGFQVLRSMQMGSGFNNFVSPDQGDISQNYTEFLTWWSPGQYVMPWFFKLITGLNTGKAIAITVTIAQLLGITGFYYFFKKIGFTPVVSAISIVFIICQQAFVVPYVYYNGGEVLLFSFEGWFLYGCVSLKKPGLGLILFILFSGWIGFFFKSSFLWMYAAGLCCLWIKLSSMGSGTAKWIKKAFWIGIPAATSLAVIYIFYISRGHSPVTTEKGFKLTSQVLDFPLASPILSGFSIDDLFHGVIYHTWKPVFNSEWGAIILILIALLSVLLIFSIIRYVPNNDYRLLLAVFYLAAILFFGFSYLRQLDISYESRHFRILGILIAPGLIYLVAKFKPVFKFLFALVFISITYVSFTYIIKGFKMNRVSAKGASGIALPNIDQSSLNYIIKLDKENRNATFVFVTNDLGLEILHNRFITLKPIDDNLKIDMDDYVYEGHAGPLFIVLPESYNGPKEKLIMKSFPGYSGFTESMLSPDYVLYAAK
jgi:hypothetical protein